MEPLTNADGSKQLFLPLFVPVDTNKGRIALLFGHPSEICFAFHGTSIGRTKSLRALLNKNSSG